MDYFKSGLKTVLGTTEPGAQPSGAEIVERLIDRVNNSTLLEDRRDACRALKALSRKHRIEVGAQGIDTLIQVIQLDRADCETVSYALDALNNVISPTPFNEEEDNPKVPLNIGEQFTEMFLKNPQNVQLGLELLAEYEFKVRLSSIRLLTALLANRPKDIQEIVLVSPMGVSKLMDLLSDSREVIRNDALLLLIQLTKGNANIQKIVAFENAFDRLFEVISSEGFSNGGIVVEDCLLLMLNLLKNNSSNQTFFKEGSYIQRMLPMFNMGDETEDSMWLPQKISNVHFMLQLIRTLVAPNNSGQLVASCQKTMRSVGLLDQLCNMLMASGVPADILTETINTVGDVVRGNVSNQEYLSNVMAPSNPPRPALVILLMSMVNEKQPFSLRCAVLYCYECFLYKNEAGQGQLVQTLLPSTSEVSNLTSGQLLCGGLFSSDTLSNWFSAVALMHALVENPVQKEQLLRVLLATNIGSSPVSLLHQCTILLQQGTKFHSKVALLMLLAVWTSYCPQAVAAFLSVPNSVSYLVAQTSSNEHDENEFLVQGLCAFLLAICVHFNDNSVESHSKESMHQLLIKRIGFETFTSKLSEVSKHEMYSRASKQPQLRAKVKEELLLDYEFTKLFKVLESLLVSNLSLESSEKTTAKVSDAKEPDESVHLDQYKSLIRQQDARLQEMAAQIGSLVQQTSHLENKIAEINSENAQVKDENTLLKAQLSTSGILPYPSTEMQNGYPESNIQTAADEDSRRVKEKQYEEKINSLLAQISDLSNQLELTEKSRSECHNELENLKKDQDDLLELLADQDMKISQYKLKLLSLGEIVDDDGAPEKDFPSV